MQRAALRASLPHVVEVALRRTDAWLDASVRDDAEDKHVLQVQQARGAGPAAHTEIPALRSESSGPFADLAVGSRALHLQ